VRKFLSIPILFLLFVSCKTAEVAQSSPVAQTLPGPNWVSSRPNSGFKFVGIGFADKKPGTNYQMEAKKNALYDLASEIKVNISSNSVLYTVQNNNKFNENYNSLIKLSNTDNIEGYELIDSYENDKQYWVYYSLDKQAYADQKAKKKQQSVVKASHLIDLAYQDEKKANFSSSLKKRIQAFSVLSPYLNEEITFDSELTHGYQNIFDLTSAIQQQLQSISLAENTKQNDIKPYQAAYSPLTYRLFLNNKVALQNFPFTVNSDDERVRLYEKTSTNGSGDLQLIITEAGVTNQRVAFSLSPDIESLLANDSVSQTSIRLLKQFVQTNTLKIQVQVSNISILVHVTEKNLGKPISQGLIAAMIQQKFTGNEFNLVDKPENADFVIEATADTQEDAGSETLQKAYNLKLASLQVNVVLKNNLKNGETFSWLVKDVYGYANTLEKAGLNAYDSEKMLSNMAEALFFAKRKVLVY
jgi:hypothetical protein